MYCLGNSETIEYFNKLLDPIPTAGRGMKLTAAGRAHVAKRKLSNTSLRPADVVNKEIAEKRRRDKARKTKVQNC